MSAAGSYFLKHVSRLSHCIIWNRLGPLSVNHKISLLAVLDGSQQPHESGHDPVQMEVQGQVVHSNLKVEFTLITVYNELSMHDT